MDDPGLVHRDQPLGEGGTHGGHVGGRQRTLLRDLVVQGGTGHVLGGEPRPVRLQVGGDEPCRAAAPDPPGRRDLAREPGTELLILRQIRPDHLQCDPLATPVGAQVDNTHTPAPSRR